MATTPEALTNVPENLNFLSPLGWKFHVRRTPHLNYFLHKVTLPGLVGVSVDQPTPFVPIKHTFDHVSFNNLTATFQVDEDLQNWLEIHSWMRNIGKADDFLEFKALHDKPEHTGFALYSEIVVTTLNSAKMPSYHFTFHGCFPISLSDITFDAQLEQVNYLKAEVVFVYTNFDYERIVNEGA